MRMKTDENNCHQWRPLEIFSNDLDLPFAIIILNQPLEDTHFTDVIFKLWKKAQIRATIDGGTNRWHEALSREKKNYDEFLPNFISGDFDSIGPSVLEFFKAKGCRVIPTPDQDYSDFTKGLKLALDVEKEKEIQLSFIIAVVNHSGRFDHIMGNIQTLFLARDWTSIPVYLLGLDSMTWLLSQGKHSLALDAKITRTWCGLLPIGAPCEHVTTTGLKWNLNDQRLMFGELVSTSNTYDDDNKGIVTIETDKPLIWSMGLSNY